MRFQVPQFIEIEDKVIGPFTFRQFVYLGGGAGICFILLRVIPFKILSIPLVVAVALFSVGLAFYKVHNRPLINVIESAFRFAMGSRLYIWKRKDAAAPTTQSKLAAQYLHLEVPKFGASKLKDMRWQIDARREENKE